MPRRSNDETTSKVEIEAVRAYAYALPHATPHPGLETQEKEMGESAMRLTALLGSSLARTHQAQLRATTAIYRWLI